MILGVPGLPPPRDTPDAGNGDTGAGRATLVAAPKQIPSLQGELPEPPGPASVPGTGGQPRLASPALRASQGCIRRRQARRERENALIIGLGRRGAQSLHPAQPPAASAHPGDAPGPAPPRQGSPCAHTAQGQILSPLGTAGHGDSRALAGTGAPNPFPKSRLQPAQGSHTPWHSPHVIQGLALPL